MRDDKIYPTDWFIIFAFALLIVLASILFGRARAETLPDCKPPACPFVETVNLGTGSLNVRAGAGTSSKVLGYVKQGVVLESRGEKNGNWFPVTWNTMQAFISADFAKCVDKAPPAPAPVPVPAPTKYAWTVPKYTSICQNYGNKIAYQSCGFHTGTDICAKQGADILALADGKIVHVGPLWLDGAKQGRGPYSVVMDHGNGMYSTYGHNSKTIVKVGDELKAGEKIGEVGSLGYSSGPHLHLEVLENTKWTGNWRAPFADVCSKYKNPMNYK